MHKIVKYRTHTYPRTDYQFKRGWRSVVPKTFEHIFKHLPDNVVAVDTRVYKQVSGYSMADATYELVDAWDWLRMGVFPTVDEVFGRLIEKHPAKYRVTSKGVWVHRTDLLNNAG